MIPNAASALRPHHALALAARYRAPDRLKSCGKRAAQTQKNSKRCSGRNRIRDTHVAEFLDRRGGWHLSQKTTEPCFVVGTDNGSTAVPPLGRKAIYKLSVRP